MSENYGLNEETIDSIMNSAFPKSTPADNKYKIIAHNDNNQPEYGGFPTRVFNVRYAENRELKAIFISSAKGGCDEDGTYTKAEITTNGLSQIYEKAPLIFEVGEIKNLMNKGIKKRPDGQFEKKISFCSESALKDALEDVKKFTDLATEAYTQMLRHTETYVDKAKFSYDVEKELHNP